MEFLLFVFGVFALGVAWRARSDARQALRIAAQLQLELSNLRDGRREHVAPDAAATRQQSAPTKPPVPATPVTVAPASVPYVSQPADAPVPAAAAKAEPAAPPSNAERTASPEGPPPEPATVAQPRPPRQSASAPQWLLNAKAWLFGGNLVAKLGLLILFIGVSFLLKYTAARVSVPIEFRLAGIVLADLALLAWGWRIRVTRPAISLPVQGAALAVLMLVTFGAFRIYHLIPASLAFGMLLILTVFTCLLAVLQDAMWLAIFGIVGGFATPILASSGSGSHIGLFTYYALLNAGVLALALLRSWRPLNVLGFIFTFTISTTWGVLRYVPENYISVQLFLLLFFAFYVSIPLAYARQQVVRLKNYVDGSLIFGTPMAGFGLQFTLVRDMPFGAAYSALALGLFYITLATMLRRRPQYALLSDAFLALGVVFGTLAIPFALDGRWTSAAWALEGAGIVWIGLRQKQKLAWMFGLLVQGGAWLSFLGTVTGLSPERALESNLWLGFVLLALTAFLMATRFRASDDSKWYNILASVFLAGAAVWLVAGAWTEIILRLEPRSQGTPLVLSAIVAVIVLYLIAQKLAWPLATWLALIVQAAAGLKLMTIIVGEWLGSTPTLFERPLPGALMIFAAALFSSWALKQQQPARGSGIYAAYRLTLTWSALWWFGVAAPDCAMWLASQDVERAQAVYALLLAATSAASVMAARRLRWAGLRWAAAVIWIAQTLALPALLGELYFGSWSLPGAPLWIGYAVLWLGSEWLLRAWPAQGWPLNGTALRVLHAVRTGGPWLMIWPVAAYWISAWLGGDDISDWSTSASWARFIPSWLMMGVIAWLMQRSRSGGWPVAPLAKWYQRRLLPLACGWAVLLVMVWNLTQDGAMLPLPYLPFLNPLDLSTCFALLLLIAAQRLRPGLPPLLLIALCGYGWFNLALLRSVSHYMGVPYRFDALFASQFVQAMLSLVWSVSALLLMRHAARRTLRPAWIGGAALLALVVAKLFLVDLSNVGGVERIVSFLGVGALMVGIGYLAPFPSQTENA
ncbi:Uncharacterized membrane protein [Duganella sp. CF402]|uniref:DUF2339 domain-containing protein n=1 Tax=unclassified Duganella TaxID=2636909 RepID=UPI0008C43C45|nr:MULTISPECIES: DUF2339 domain-containing protein [unclassified Duganella]RZT06061.1 putative membrane protein [Duganella sp. BK701]SEM77486.1 Uncharacterized membrane protein [Duganella sp. CF402]